MFLVNYIHATWIRVKCIESCAYFKIHQKKLKWPDRRTIRRGSYMTKHEQEKVNSRFLGYVYGRKLNNYFKLSIFL